MTTEDYIGLAYFTLIFMTLGMITGACMVRRMEALGRAIEEEEEKYVN